MGNLTRAMIDGLNLKLKEEGTSLRYRLLSKDGHTLSYELVVVDKYIDGKYGQSLNLTDEFEKMVREFFKGYGVESTGFTNTVKTIVAWE